MAFTEDLSVFFDTTSGFAVVATVGGESVNVILDWPTQDVSEFTKSDEYAITGAYSDLSSLTRGTVVIVDARQAGLSQYEQFKVREPDRLDDGRLIRATLTRFPAAGSNV